MLGYVNWSRGVSAAEALNARFGIARFLHLLSVKARDMDKDNNPSNHIRIRVGRWPTLTSRTGYLSKFRRGLPTNRPGIMGAEFM